MIRGIYFMAMACLGTSCLDNIKPPHDDSLLEEIVEDIIKQHTGIDLDLTPNSEENNDTK